MTLSLADLRTPETQEIIETRLLAALAARGLPVAAWVPAEQGGVERTSVRMVAGTLSKLVGSKIAKAVSGRFLDLATGDSLTYLARRYFQLDRNPATSTNQNVQLSSVVTAPSNSFAPGDVWVSAPATGNRYYNLDPIDLPPGSSDRTGQHAGVFDPFAVQARFQAELPGASYSDPAGTITTMVTAPAGVSCVNVGRFDYNPAHQVGSSTGQISARGHDHDGVTHPIYESVRVQIYVFGDIGTAAFKYSLDGGLSWVDGGIVPSTPFVILGPPGNEFAGAELRFVNGTTPSFLQGSIYTLLLANAILQQGADAETDESLRARCRDRWTSLSLVPTEGLVRLWAEQASAEVHKVVVDADVYTPGGIIVTLASSAGPATAACQIAVSDYIEARLQGFKGVPEAAAGAGSPEETAQVRSAVPLPITPAGTVSVLRSKLAATQIEANRLWLEYLRGVPIGGEVVLAELEQQLMDAGAVTFSGVLLNGVNRNVQLADGEVAVAADGTSLTTSMQWKPA